MSIFTIVDHKVDFCVVGGGIAGLCAAVSAARHGAKVALIQERPMLGGNASSEIRMWVCGAHGDNNRETGIIEELMLENQFRNPYKNYSIWDSIMLEKVQSEPNIELFLNCSCMHGDVKGNVLKKIYCWQMTTQKFHTFSADIFADCSGDSILAPITSALYRVGREGKDEYGEDIAPNEADKHTMGMSCMIQAREYTQEREFIPPKWAKKFTKEDLPYRTPNLDSPSENFWYMELGGEQDSIADTEEIRDELLRIAYGIWDYLKNDPENKQKNAKFDIDWIGILPGKRESRRYIGDYVMSQADVRNGGHFDDLIAYGGWSMDDHHPGGIYSKEPPTIFHEAPSPYGIPYRTLYSKNVENLMFAGRNISVTHTAMSSSRVMATCGILGQATGTAAGIALKYKVSPRGVYEKHIYELKQKLMEDDCYLPYNKREITKLTADANLISDMSNPDNLRNGYDRPLGVADNGSLGKKNCFVEYQLADAFYVGQIHIVFDSDLNRETLPKTERELCRGMRHNILLDWEKSYMPKTVIRSFDVIFGLADGSEIKKSITDNHQRVCNIVCGMKIVYARLIFKTTWGCEDYHVFSVDLW